MNVLVFKGDDGKQWYTGPQTSWSPNYRYVYNENGNVSVRSTALIHLVIERLKNGSSS